METVHHTGAAFEALERSGIRAVAGKCLMDAPPEGAPLELAESTDAALAEAESLARRWHGAAGDRLRVCFAPRFVPSCSGPLLRAASELANLFGAQLHTHAAETIDRKSTRLNSSHSQISYAVFCLKKKNKEGDLPRVGPHGAGYEACHRAGVLPYALYH